MTDIENIGTKSLNDLKNDSMATALEESLSASTKEVYHLIKRKVLMLNLMTANKFLVGIFILNFVFIIVSLWMLLNSYTIEEYLLDGADSNNDKVVTYFSDHGIDRERP